MSNTPNNPFNPQPEKGPWLYTGAQQPTPAYTPPSTPSQPIPATSASATASTAAAIPTPNSPTKKEEDASLASIIDTIEAIIIALILALTFRAFIVEAFVIPTGSMAPTLLGAHFKVTCPKCGYAFDRDANLDFQLEQQTRTDGKIVHHDRAELFSNRTVPADGSPSPAPLICPNCQHIIPYNSLPQFLGYVEANDSVRGRGTRPVPFAWANNGDRILVLKYIYSILEPSRFDVIVFKEPRFAQDNYIKRLIGLPGETIEIINGDIFVAPPGKSATQDRTIARKPAHLQTRLWQLIYDNDFYPTDENTVRPHAADTDNLPKEYFLWQNPWQGSGPTAKSWNANENAETGTVGGPVIHYKADAPGALHFNIRDPYTFNILGYNNDIQDLPSYRARNLLRVGDLHLETVWTPEQAGGTSIALTAGLFRNLYRAVWSNAGIDLQHYNLHTHNFDSVKADSVTAIPAPKPGQAYRVEFNNVDHALQFVIDGKIVLQHLVPWNAVDARNEYSEFQTAQDADEDAKRTGHRNDQATAVLDTFRPEITLEVGGRCTVSHLKLMRDLYYTQNYYPARVPGTANTDHPLTLGPDEFFAMGDNSRRSHDGRSWETVYPALDDLGTRLGIVPRRYLLGKAFFVYWPAGYRLTSDDKIPVLSGVPLVPNAGDMRFIR